MKKPRKRAKKTRPKATPAKKTAPNPGPVADEATLLRQIEASNLANLVAKTAGGGTMSTQEAAWVQQRLAAMTKTDQAPGPHQLDLVKPGRWAKNQTEAAKALGVSRPRLRRWRVKFGDQAPAQRSDGKEDLDAWRTFVADRGLGGGKTRDRDQDEVDAGEVRRLAEARKIQAQADFLEHKMATARGDLVDRATESQVWVALMIGLRSRLVASANGLASRAAMLRAPAKIKALLLASFRSSMKGTAANAFSSFTCPNCKHEIKHD